MATSTGEREYARALARATALVEQGRMVANLEEGEMDLNNLEGLILADYRVNGRKSVARVCSTFRAFRDHWGQQVKIKEITGEQLMDYARKRMEDHARGSVRTELRVLQRAMHIALQFGKLRKLPIFPRIQASPPRKGFLDIAQLEAICQHLPTHIQPAIQFLGFTGWRSGEMRNLTWLGVDFPGGTLRLEGDETKNRQAREFPFSVLPPLETILKEQRRRATLLEQLHGRPVRWVFFSLAGQQLGDFRKSWKHAARLAGLPNAVPHDLRRSAVRALERAGVSRSVAMAITGHRTASVYQHYAITPSQDLVEGVKKLRRLLDDDKTVEETPAT